jgi:hypothetical protein
MVFLSFLHGKLILSSFIILEIVRKGETEDNGTKGDERTCAIAVAPESPGGHSMEHLTNLLSFALKSGVS